MTDTSLQQQTFPELMAQLAGESFTGTLIATLDQTRRDILYTYGEIRAARSHIEEEKLGLWLVGRELISEADMALTLLAQGGIEAPPLGHLLVTRGCIGQQQLEEELEALALAIICRAAALGSSCELRPERDSHPDTLPNLTTTQIILFAARDYGDFEAKKTALGSLEQNVWRSTAFDDMLQQLSLTPTEAFLLSRLDGTSKLSSLISISALAEQQAIATLYALKTAGLVFVGEPTDSAQPNRRETLRTLRAAEESRLAVDESTLSSSQFEERTRVRKLAAMVSRVDHYQALGVERIAGGAEIREAWRSMQNKYAPTRSVMPHLRDLQDELTAVHERAGEAYEVLSRPAKRQRYDKILASYSEEGSKKAVSTEARAALVEANIKRADELIRDGEPYLAIQLLEQACRIDPRPPQLTKLAHLLMRNPLWVNRALVSLRRATEIDPNYTDAWVELSELWRQRNNPERQRKALERALASDPEHERAGRLYVKVASAKELKRFQQRARLAKR